MNKIKIYLDTNAIFDFFLNHLRQIKLNEKLKIPRKFQFFMDSLDNIEITVSFLTKVEIMRKMRSEFGASVEDVEFIWEEFTKLLAANYIEETKLDKKLIDIVAKTPMKKKTVINFAHLFIAMDLNYYFLSGDGNLIKIIKKENVYDKAISYVDLRKMLP